MPDEALAVHQSDRDGVRLVEVFGELDLAKARIGAAGCEKEPICDQISFITAGAVDTPPIPWQDRPTFQQVVEIR